MKYTVHYVKPQFTAVVFLLGGLKKVRKANEFISIKPALPHVGHSADRKDD